MINLKQDSEQWEYDIIIISTSQKILRNLADAAGLGVPLLQTDVSFDNGHMTLDRVNAGSHSLCYASSNNVKNRPLRHDIWLMSIWSRYARMIESLTCSRKNYLGQNVITYVLNVFPLGELVFFLFDVARIGVSTSLLHYTSCGGENTCHLHGRSRRCVQILTYSKSLLFFASTHCHPTTFI